MTSSRAFLRIDAYSRFLWFHEDMDPPEGTVLYTPSANIPNGPVALDAAIAYDLANRTPRLMT